MVLLYQDESELLFSPRSSVLHLSWTLVDELITPEPSARNLKIILNKYLSLNDHVCKTSYFHLRNISKIRKFLTKESTEILTCFFQLKAGRLLLVVLWTVS